MAGSILGCFIHHVRSLTIYASYIALDLFFGFIVGISAIREYIFYFILFLINQTRE